MMKQKYYKIVILVTLIVLHVCGMYAYLVLHNVETTGMKTLNTSKDTVK